MKSIPAEVVVTTIVQEHELQTLQRLDDEDNEGANQFEAAITQGLLKVVDFVSVEEEESFVNYAAILDDGESATCAIAVHRNWVIATDDKKAISFLKKEAPQIQVLLTIEIIKYWSDKEGLDSSTLRDALSEIRIKGRYLPPKNHPLREWWETSSNNV